MGKLKKQKIAWFAWSIALGICFMGTHKLAAMSFTASANIANKALATLASLTAEVVASDTAKLTRPIVRSYNKTADSLFLEGVKWEISEQAEKAINAFEAALFMDGSNAAACYGIATAKLGQQKPSEALVYMEKAVRLDSQNKWYLLRLADLYMGMRIYPKAAGAYRKLLKMDSTQIEIADRLSQVYILQGEPLMAVKVYDELENTFEPCDEWSMKKYKIYNLIDKPKEAKEEIEKISKFIPGEPKYYEILAQISVEEKDYESAYKYYQKVIELKPDDVYAQASMADYYRKISKETEALLTMMTVLGSSGMDVDNKVNLLVSFLENKPKYTPEETVLLGKLLDTMLIQYPQYWRLYYMKSFYYIEQGDAKSARPLMRLYLDKENKNPKLFEVLLYLDQRLGDWKATAEDAVEAISKFPELASPYVFASLAYHMLSNCDSATYYGEKGMDRTQYVSGDDRKIWRYTLYGVLGECYFTLGEYQKGMQIMDAAMEEYPEDLTFRNNYAYQLSIIKERLEEAVAWAKENCRLQPGEPSFWDTYAWALFQKGQYKEALSAIKFALRKGGKSEYVIWEHLGDILFYLGKKDKALEAWQQAAELAGKKLPNNSVLLRKISERKWIEAPR